MPEQRFLVQLAKYQLGEAKRPASESSPRTRDLSLQIVQDALLPAISGYTVK